jgi:Fe-S cluster assembly iron-binding protein IscA
MKVTPNALKELKKVLDSKKNSILGVRIFAAYGNCGHLLQLEVGVKQITGEKVVTVDSVNFFVEESTVGLLKKLTIDFISNKFELIEGEQSGNCCC